MRMAQRKRHRPQIYERDLGRDPANYVPLSPLSFLARSAATYPRMVGANQLAGIMCREIKFPIVIQCTFKWYTVTGQLG